MIAVEEGENHASAVVGLVKAHRDGLIRVGLTTVSASETLADGTKRFPASAKQFRSRVSALGWDDLDLLLGPAVIGLTYLDLCKWVDDEFESQRDQIWAILFPTLERELRSEVTEKELHSSCFKKWRNAWCDVHTLWTHLDAERDVFVTTNTRDFQRHATELARIGLKAVLTPEEAEALLPKGGGNRA